MQFDLDPEQALLRDSLARFVDRTSAGPARSSDPDVDAAAWRIFAENGWLAAALPEAHGGLGGSIVETAIICEQFGRGLVLEPYLGCAVLAAQTFAAAAAHFQQADWLPAVADGRRRLALAHGGDHEAGPALRADYSGGSWRISGPRVLVLGGERADAFIVPAFFGPRGETSLFLVASGSVGMHREIVRLHDGRGAAWLGLERVEGCMLSIAGGGESALRVGLAHGVIGLCAELIGVMEKSIEITAEHLRTRRQFGTPLAAMQVLQHRMADMAADLELSRSMLFAALAALEGGDPGRRDVVMSGAKALICEAALAVCGQAIQLHGGLGMTEEYSIGRFYKRAVVNAGLLGSTSLHEQACAAALTERIVGPAKRRRTANERAR